MATLTLLDPAKLPGPASLLEARVRAAARFAAGPLPTDADEIWRYSRIGELDVGAFAVVRPSAPSGDPAAVRQALDLVGRRSATALTVDGVLASNKPGEAPRGLHVQGVREGDGFGRLSEAATPWDAFAELNLAQAPTPLVVDVPDGTVVDAPIVVCHWTSAAGAVTFPRTLLRVGVNASVTLLEYHLSADVNAWVDPVTEIEVADGGHADHLVVQELGPSVWQTAYIAGTVGRDASLRVFTVSLGGDYARVRTDSTITGTGGDAQLLALYCGNGTQMHDFRTLQDHAAAKSTSDLVFKGAVADEARSAYSGLIRVRRGAAGTRAFQTNRNLVLSDTGLATYSVPNLEIEENDVSCSHASATGPIDRDQVFYLESRGVPTEVAERLVVLGFFSDLLERFPLQGVRDHIVHAIGTKLALEAPGG